MKHFIYPIFLPMQGCPHRCLYCDQSKISGGGQTDLNTELQNVARFVANHSLQEKEIAFYGGSFTALSEARRNSIISSFAAVIDPHTSFRISTHPLYINTAILQQCKAQGIMCIELGIQDFSTQVLQATQRPYNKAIAMQAAQLVTQHGFKLGIQLLPGLPESNAATIAENLQALKQLKPQYLRLYPLIVIKGTPLAEMYVQGLYQPLQLEQAVNICADYAEFAEAEGIQIIKLGLPSNLQESDILAGPFHPAFGEFVKAELLIRQIIRHLSQGQEIKLDKSQRALILSHRGIIKANLEKRLENCSLNKELITGLY